MTAHSLEPMRPWKQAQLGGGGFRLTSWMERTAYETADAVIAVSDGMLRDILDCYPAVRPDRVHVVRNGVDVTTYYPDEQSNLLGELGVDPERPVVAYAGRLTAQKGLPLALAAARHIDPAAQLVICAWAPDTPELGAEARRQVQRLSASRPGTVLIPRSLSTSAVRQLLSRAAVFLSTSIYEPLGLVNLEAMACGTPVVATAVGGVPEVVIHLRTGLLVNIDPDDPGACAADLAAAVNTLLRDPRRARRLGRAGRRMVSQRFSWERAARDTLAIYRSVVAGRGTRPDASPATGSLRIPRQRGEVDLQGTTPAIDDLRDAVE